MKTSIFQITSAVLTAVLFTSCAGQSSNPASKYSFKAVPEHGKTSPDQTIAPKVFELKVEGTNENNVANFTEGKPGEVKIRVQINATAVGGYEFKPTGIPQGATLTRSKEDPNTLIFAWTPPLGIVPAGKNNTLQAFPVVVDFYVTNPEDPRLNHLTQSASFRVNVAKVDSQPVFVGTSDVFKNGVNEGEIIPFSVDVKDPVYGSVAPKVYRYNYLSKNLENYKADAANFVLPSEKFPAPVSLGGNTWRFFYDLNLVRNDLPQALDRQGKEDKNADSVEICFVLRAQDASDNFSSEKLICTTGYYGAQNPKLTLENPEQLKFSAGVESTLKMKLTTFNNRGELNLEMLSPALSSLSGGAAQLQCQAPEAGTSARVCELKWKPSCTKTSYKKVVKFKLTNRVGKKEKTQTVPQTLEVATNAEACPVPTPAPRKPAAKQPIRPAAKQPIKPAAKKPVAPASRTGGSK